MSNRIKRAGMLSGNMKRWLKESGYPRGGRGGFVRHVWRAVCCMIVRQECGIWGMWTSSRVGWTNVIGMYGVMWMANLCDRWRRGMRIWLMCDRGCELSRWSGRLIWLCVWRRVKGCSLRRDAHLSLRQDNKSISWNEMLIRRQR